ncbi:CLUMA_CG003531, isoform A [Clunio marinus]|uniref:CLUMA_CG003531, isoform A n=1 Tax=Clunio marinus TaxID=568069 RepID=A0A1J1HP25_9DIPT|nr:CLUMA_CG003531, isoform A [Clunio marinus]
MNEVEGGGHNAKITLENVIYSSEPKYANVTAVIWKHLDKTFLNVSAETFEDLDKMVLTFKFAVSNSQNFNAENVILTSTITSCKLNEGNRDAKFLPAFLTMGPPIKQTVNVKFDGKLSSTKKLVPLFTFKVFGEISH